jgi:hypothetical protein
MGRSHPRCLPGHYCDGRRSEWHSDAVAREKQDVKRAIARYPIGDAASPLRAYRTSETTATVFLILPDARPSILLIILGEPRP